MSRLFSNRRRRLRAELLEPRLALALYTVNLAGDALDPNPSDGIWDVDPDTAGIQLTFAAAAQAINDDGNGGGTIEFGIDGTFSGVTFNNSVGIDGKLHNIDLNGGEINMLAGGELINAKVAHGAISITGNNARIENNTFTTPAQPSALRVIGNTATIKNNGVSGGNVVVQGNGASLQNNSISLGGVQLIGNNNTLLNSIVLQSPTAGVLIVGSGNRVEGSQIGVTNDTDLGNALDGVAIDGTTVSSVGNLIVGNLISGNGGNGVAIRGTLSSNNSVQGNKIGTNGAGTAAIANSLAGVLIADSHDNTIGGTAVGTGNVISGNTGDGVRITGSTSYENKLQSNIIGLNVGGTAKLANGAVGVVIVGGHNNAIGVANGGNIISGNTSHGVHLSASAFANTLVGNLVGTSAGDPAGLGNGGDGVRIENAYQNSINGTTAANRISGNTGSGVRITGATATENVIRVSLIGITLTNTALPNLQGGVTISNGASENIVGGENIDGGAFSRNYIAGNALWGVAINGASDNRVSGNYIGTKLDGSAAVGAQPVGVLIENGATNNLVGFGLGGTRNLISGNAGDGVEIRGQGTINNTITGNTIGLSATLAAAVPNGGYGIRVHDHAAQNSLGVQSTSTDHISVITGNVLGGIALLDHANQNRVMNNRIGYNTSETTTTYPNTGPGITIDNSQNNVIGGVGVGTFNVLHRNGSEGVLVRNGSLGNTIQSNYIFVNGGPGIAFSGTPGVLTPTVVLRQITVATATNPPDPARILGQVVGEPNSTVRIDFYRSSQADPSGFGEAETPIGSINVSINADGIGEFNVQYATPANQFITAAVTDSSNTTYGLSRATKIAHIVTGVTSITTSTPTNAVQPIQLTANVQAASGTIAGDVDFYAGNQFLGTATIASGQAKLTTMLSVGQVSIRAIYKGTSSFAAAVGTPLAVNVVAGPPNIPPTANTDNILVQEDGTVVINVLTNDVDPDGGTLVVTSVVITQQPTHGTTTLDPATGLITYKPTTNYDGPDTFRYTVTDNRGGVSAPGIVNITVSDIPEPWHNKTKPLDVDGDGLITPTDAVAIINLINFRGPGELAAPIGGAHPPYVDVDGDNFLSPTDVVLVINAINAGRQSESDEPLSPSFVGGAGMSTMPSIEIPESEFPAPLNITPEQFAAANEGSFSLADTFAKTAYYYQLVAADGQSDEATRAARAPQATLIDAALIEWDESN